MKQVGFDIDAICEWLEADSFAHLDSFFTFVDTLVDLKKTSNLRNFIDRLKIKDLPAIQKKLFSLS